MNCPSSRIQYYIRNNTIFFFKFINIRSLDIYFSDDGNRPLYPHHFVEYNILVPNDRIDEADTLGKFLKSPLFSIWASSIGVFSIVRMIFRKLPHWNRIYATTSHNDLVYIPFNTIGLAFGTTAAHGIQSRAELVLVLYISIFCLLGGILCTGFLFEQLTTVNSVPAINSVNELFEQTDQQLFRPNIDGMYYSVFPDP